MKSCLENRKKRTFWRQLVSKNLLCPPMKSYSENQKMRTVSPELVSDILLRLPVKSLLRFRCLSTSLCNEIDSPDFIKNHLKKSILSQIRQKLIVNNRNGTHFYTVEFDGDLKEVTALNYPFKSPCATPLVVGGSCNGLILLVLGKSKLTLWNPFTRRYKSIPPCPVETLPGRPKIIYLLGLGYDSALDDYKIVMASFFENSGRRHLSFPSWVFSLKRNSWRRSQDDPVNSEEKLPWKASFANDGLIWHCHGDKIFAFDLTEEVFFNKTLSAEYSSILIKRRYPPQLHLHFYHDTMAVFRGNKLYTTKITDESKALKFYLHVSDKGRLGSWKEAFEMEDDEIEWPLNVGGKGYRLALPWPLAYSKDGDSILVYEKNQVFWYNPETKSRQRVEILGIPPADQRRRECYNFDVCWESLVSLGKEDVFDAAPEISCFEKLREIAAANLSAMNLARLACIFLFIMFIFLVFLVYHLPKLVNLPQ